ncbi:ABC transporter ATP-binding protein [Streptomyces thermolineatus]|uniref:ABC transporter ATP-binding protein n=1 Tax=Streptomyces thermolineatus TaxID=44033 RepID=UPI003850C111
MGRTGRRRERRPATERTTSTSEEALFGGPLRYDTRWARHEQAFLRLGLVTVARRLPAMVRGAVRLAWRADRNALLLVGAAELGRGATQAVGLLAANEVLRALFAAGPIAERLHTALPALVLATAASVATTLLACASVAGTGRVEPKVERLATEQYLECATRVELGAVEDAEFHRLLDGAQFGAASCRYMVGHCVSTLNGLIAFVAAAGVLGVLHPVLLPLLVLIALPRTWGALRVARQRYVSTHTWMEHTRAARLLGHLLTERTAAQEVRVHAVGRFLLGHYRTMSETAETEQTRLARHRAATELAAAAMAGAASLATYGALAALLLAGAMEISVAGTAVLAIRTGSSSLAALVQHVNRLYEESLFVGDLDRLIAEAGRRTIPEGGHPLPERPRHVRFENVTFTYPGSDRPALREVDLTVETGKVVALVGENGSGKSTLAKLLAGLYRPDSGRVLWDGVDAAEADRDDLFSRVALVTQDFQRWPFTAESNVVIGLPSRPGDRERLEESAAYSGVDEVLPTLPKGWRTLLARQFRGGHELSGGQWQRFGIARAHYRSAPVLICDEPTSALDPRAEIETFDRIRGLAGTGRTVVLVTHRLASVQHADTICVLRRGRLVEQGTHRELMALPGGLYRELFRMQADQYAEPGTHAGPGTGAADRGAEGPAVPSPAASPETPVPVAGDGPQPGAGGGAGAPAP